MNLLGGNGSELYTNQRNFQQMKCEQNMMIDDYIYIYFFFQETKICFFSITWFVFFMSYLFQY